MNTIWNVLENLNDNVYAADVDTNEILFINKKMRDEMGIRSVEEVKHKKCYDVICHKHKRPDGCNPEGKEPYVYNVSYDYDIENKTYSIKKDAFIPFDGRNIRLEITTDQPEEDYPKDHRQLEALANKLLNIAFMESTPDESINTLMKHLGTYFKADRAYIFERNPDMTNSNTYEWVAKGVTPQLDLLQNVPEEASRSWYDTFKKDRAIILEDIEDIRETDVPLYETLKPQDIRSLVVVPLYKDNKIIGFFGVDNPDPSCLDYTFEMIQLLCRFIVFSIERRIMTKQLEEIGYMDQLTGFFNRYALNKYVREDMLETQQIGIVYCDIIGLKRINDTEGHYAGDRYIRDCCDLIREAFNDATHYRIGGDELVTLCPDVSEDELRQKVTLLKQSMSENNVLLSIGAVHKTGDFNFEKVLSEAEKLMYEDKSSYYRSTGIDRRNS